MRTAKFIIGIDEAGRGPLAGPVAVGVVCVERRAYPKLFIGARDSKQISSEKRDAWFAHLKELTQAGDVRYAVGFSSARIIDRKGIVFAIQSAMKQALTKIGVNPTECEVLLDGALHAPQEYIHQRTIIRGDATERIISIASIAAKVTRDRKMSVLARQYPEYDFHVHKGYGTRLHYEKLLSFGPSFIHRRSFLKSLHL